MTGLSSSLKLLSNADEPAVVGIGSRVSMLSLINTGTPSKGPSVAPASRRSSLSFACSRECGFMAMTLRNLGPLPSSNSIRLRYISTACSEVMSPEVRAARRSDKSGMADVCSIADKTSLDHCSVSGLSARWQLAEPRKVQTIATRSAIRKCRVFIMSVGEA